MREGMMCNPWWYEYVGYAIECLEDKDYQEAKDLLKEIIEYAALDPVVQ